MKSYNIKSNLNSYAGSNNYSVAIGTTRNIKGSSNRIYEYCGRYSETPLYCTFQFPPPTSSPTPPTPPTTPSAPIITSIIPTSTTLTINFTSPTSDGGTPITNYKYSLDNGTTFTLLSPASTESPFVVSGLTPVTSYNVIIRAINIVGDGLLSNNVSITTLPPSWSGLGNGITGTNNFCNAIAVDTSNNIVYAGGMFTSNIIKWDGTTWSGLVGGGLSSNCNTIAFDSSNNVVYAGGVFTTAGGTVPANRIAQWDGTSWSGLGGGPNNGLTGGNQVSCNAIAFGTINNIVYAGGRFTNAGDISANNIAQWDGNNWSALPSGPNNGLTGGFCNAIAFDTVNNVVYVGGSFTTSTNTGGRNVTVNRIAKWDTNTNSWSALGSGLIGGTLPSCNAIAFDPSNNVVYAGGSFTTAANTGGGLVNVNNIAKWDGNNWSALGGGFNGTCSAIAFDPCNNVVYAGGNFTTAANTGGGLVNVNNIAKWDGNNWSALPTGPNNGLTGGTQTGCRAIVFDAVRDIVYAGGIFTTATNTGGGTVAVNNIAKFM